MTSAEPLQRPLLSTHTDDKVDLDPKMASDQLPPSYQTASEAAPDSEPAQSGCCRHRRRCRRFGHFVVALLVLWLTARHIVRHCQLRRFAHPDPHADDSPWVGLSQYGRTELNRTELVGHFPSTLGSLSSWPSSRAWRSPAPPWRPHRLLH